MMMMIKIENHRKSLARQALFKNLPRPLSCNGIPFADETVMIARICSEIGLFRKIFACVPCVSNLTHSGLWKEKWNKLSKFLRLKEKREKSCTLMTNGLRMDRRQCNKSWKSNTDTSTINHSNFATTKENQKQNNWRIKQKNIHTRNMREWTIAINLNWKNCNYGMLLNICS